VNPDPLERFAAALALYREFQQQTAGAVHPGWEEFVHRHAELAPYLELLRNACPTAAASETTTLPHVGWLALEPGGSFGRYRLERFLGQGGMGAVWLAEHLEHRRPVALKVLRDEIGSADVRERFAREAHAAARLDHPNICPVYEYGEYSGVPYIAMAYVEGESLHARIQRPDWEGARTRQGIAACVLLIRGVASALHHAHEHGVVHRDVKPGNILMTPDGRPVLVDFGIARDVHNAGLTLTNGAVGTLRYMAPEQLRGEPPTRAVDVYGLGMTLYECLSGTTAFADAPVAAMEDAILHRPLPRLCPRPALAARDLDAVLAMALAKGPGQRYRTAVDLAEDFSRAATGRPTRARPPSLSRRLGWWVAGNRAAAGLIAAMVLGAVALAWVTARRDAEVRRNALSAWTVRTRSAVEAAAGLVPPWPSLGGAMAAWQRDVAGPTLAATAELLADGGDDGVELRERRADLERAAAEVRRDAQHAEALARLAEGEHRHLWSEARTALLAADGVSASRRYAEAPVDLSPQLGLVPIGANPRTGLWEFCHLDSGTAAPPSVRDFDDDGRLPVTSHSGIVFVLIPGGDYVIGAGEAGVHASAYHGGDDERQHRVRLEPFFLGKYELTFGQWQALADEPTDADRLRGGARSAGEGDRPLRPDDLVCGVRLTPCHPLLGRGHDQVQQVLSRHGLTPPTEAQWEAACRASTTTAWSTGDTPASLDGAANVRDRAGARVFPEWQAKAYFDDRHVGPSEVGSFLPNGYGLFDMHGNAYEWCLDWYGSYRHPTRAGDGLREVPAEEAFERVLRGGCFSEPAEACRSSVRSLSYPRVEDDRFGVRACRPVLRVH